MTPTDTLAPRDRAAIIILLIASFAGIINETIMPNLRDDYQSDAKETS